jgi:hypothetical protein
VQFNRYEVNQGNKLTQSEKMGQDALTHAVKRAGSVAHVFCMRKNVFIEVAGNC